MPAPPRRAQRRCPALHRAFAAVQLADAVARDEQVVPAEPEPERSLSERCPRTRCWLVHSKSHTMLLRLGVRLEGFAAS